MEFTTEDLMKSTYESKPCFLVSGINELILLISCASSLKSVRIIKQSLKKRLDHVSVSGHPSLPFFVSRSELGRGFSSILFNMRNNPSHSKYCLISCLSCSLPHLTLLFHSVNNIVYQYDNINDDFMIFFLL
jgi:hypothetical protein